MKTRLVATLIALNSVIAVAYQPNVRTGKPYTPIYVSDDKTFEDFSSRSLSINSFDITVSAPSEFMTFRGHCDTWWEVSRSEWGTPFRAALSKGDYFLFNHPENCTSMNFNHIQIKAIDMKANQLEVRLGSFKYYTLNRYTVREQYRDPTMDHTVTVIADCHHEYTDAGFWRTDFFKCKLPDNGGTMTFTVNGPLGF